MGIRSGLATGQIAIKNPKHKMIKLKKAMMLMAITAVSLSAAGQASRRDSIWAPVKALLGSWKGTGGGEPGIGKYERSYKLVLAGNFIEIRNKSTYAPTEKHPKGEVHEDIGYIIYDLNRKTFLLRQLHVEGFANDYVLESISPDKKTMVFVTENIVNIPKGWRARETYRFGEKEFEEVFELASPGKGFEPYSKVKFTKR